jgi:hypothetical protein
MPGWWKSYIHCIRWGNDRIGNRVWRRHTGVLKVANKRLAISAINRRRVNLYGIDLNLSKRRIISPSQRRHLARLASQQHQPSCPPRQPFTICPQWHPHTLSHLHLREHGALEGHNSLSHGFSGDWVTAVSISKHWTSDSPLTRSLALTWFGTLRYNNIKCLKLNHSSLCIYTYFLNRSHFQYKG